MAVDHRVPDSIPLDQGILAATEAVLACYRAPPLDELPPLHSGLMGYLGYDVVREVEHLPDAPTDDRGLPDAVLSIIGELAAFDHFRQRVTLVANAWIPPDATDDELDRAYDEAVARLDQLAIDGASPLDEPLVEPPSTTDELPEITSSMGSDSYCQAVEVARSTSWPVTSSRSSCPSASTSCSTPTRSTRIGCCARSIPARTCTSSGSPSSR